MANMGEIAVSNVPDDGKPWYAEMNRYHWWILFVSALGWLFDTMDQTLFRVSRQDAISDLLNLPGSDPKVKFYGGLATAIFLIGWATGGLIFGILGDKWGRAKTMLLTIILYSAFTGLSALSTGVYDYSFYRFLTGLGVGGEFAAGVALVSEALPQRARPFALGLLQALSAVGNIMGSFVCLWLLRIKHLPVEMPSFLSTTGESWVWDLTGWRLVMLAGILPAMLVIAVRRRLKEPESWVRAKEAAASGDLSKELGSLRDLFGDVRWRRNVTVGILLAMAGVIGVWGVGFSTPELVGDLVERHNIAHPDAPINGSTLKSYQAMFQDVGAFFGMLAFTWMATSLGRKPAFFMALLFAYSAPLLVFLYMDEPTDVYWMAPLLGFFMMMIFGGYAIYFPELFPTRLRSTGTAFCYNVARYLAAVGPFLVGYLTTAIKDIIAKGSEDPAVVASANNWSFRYAAIIVLSVYLIGMVTLYFAPETKGKPLPED